MVRLINFIIIFLITLSTGVYATSMGSVVKNDYSKIKVDESAKFTVLFWNTANESYKLELNAELPKDWIIIFEPNDFILNETTGKELIKLPYENDYKKATPIDILVKPPSSIKPGKYKIIVKAISILPQKGISFSQERSFNFLVEIENPLYFESPSEKKTTSQTNNLSQYQRKENSIVGNSNYFYIIIVIIIFLISILIYKYS
jgi:uncharacterized membrane protein